VLLHSNNKYLGLVRLKFHTPFYPFRRAKSVARLTESSFYNIFLNLTPTTTMNETISNNALIYATLALNSEVDLQRDYLESDDVPEDERDNEEEILADLEQAFMEFVDLYKNRCKADKDLPSIDELLNSQL
jgi:hypothetical protein